MALLTAAQLLVTRQLAAQAADSGAVSMFARASGYMDLTSGGPAILTGSSGGSVTNNKARGFPLTGLTVSLGEIGPVNTQPFVKVTVPLRIRSNTAYDLAMSATQIVTSNPNALSSADIGFGIGRIARSDANVQSGADSAAPGVLGDPTLDPDALPATDRWDYVRGKRLSDYATAAGVVSGSRIMKPVPSQLPDGLTVDLIFCVKPQFFAPGNFSTTITLTVATP